jgi:dolichol-phosphate mannosyltransferase
MQRTTAPGASAALARTRGALGRSENWLQLIRFCLVGASGYVVNLVTFTVLVHALDLDYRLAATGAFLVAVTNNFAWNRHWTFDARDGHAGFQAARFLIVSVVAFGFNLAFLELLVSALGFTLLFGAIVLMRMRTELARNKVEARLRRMAS